MFVDSRSDYHVTCPDLYCSQLTAWKSKIRKMVGEWLGVYGIPIELFQMTWCDGFSSPSILGRQNSLVLGPGGI
jgi:hypothetical protein